MTVGSVVVYVIASCASGAMLSAQGGADGGGLLDAFVPTDAIAGGSTAPDSAQDVPCSVTVTPPGGGGVVSTWAVASFPGRSADDLSRGRAILCYPASVSASSPPGFSCYTVSLAVQNGSVAIQCGIQGGTATVTSARIIMPAPTS